jgi:acyl-CoA synthetase (NDP forming)
MDLRRLLHPRTVAVVGATDREGSYAGETLLNLAAAGVRSDPECESSIRGIWPPGYPAASRGT